MFEKVLKETIIVLIEESENTYISIPNGEAILFSQRIWAMSEWVHDEFVKDAEASDDWRQENFHIRNISRTFSYINQASVLEGVLRRAYNQMISDMQMYEIGSIGADNRAQDLRWKEFEQLREFRNTVSAHTVYAKPEEGKDDALTEINSLQSILALGFENEDMRSFSLGGVEVTAGDGEKSRRRIPKAKIFDLKEDMEKHYACWEKMFVTKLQEAHKSLPVSRKTENGVFKVDKRFKV